jgi:hypothetical protein
MAFMSQEKKKKIAAALKALKIPASFKYSLAVRHHSTLVVTISQAPATVFDDYIGHLDANGYERELMYGETKNSLQRFEEDGSKDINLFHLDSAFKGQTLAVLEKMVAAIKAAGEWFDESDSQTDYFHTAFYIDLQFGRYDKPCKFVGKRRPTNAITEEPANIPFVDVSGSLSDETIGEFHAEVNAIMSNVIDFPGVPEVVTGSTANPETVADEDAVDATITRLVERGVGFMRTTVFGQALTEEAMTVLSRAVVEGLLDLDVTK